SKDKDLKSSILTLLGVAPTFVSSLLRRYVESYSEGKIDRLVPFESERVRKALDESLTIQRELLEGFSSLSSSEKEPILNFLKKVS
ncbi:MAG: hypothetical protein KGH88_09930, partial [Thaumarchaeota archaeon]|nr:hypothetical protein [Nitrososphaerota archaeon]